jgi:hypothetical protein
VQNSRLFVQNNSEIAGDLSDKSQEITDITGKLLFSNTLIINSLKIIAC